MCIEELAGCRLTLDDLAEAGLVFGDKDAVPDGSVLVSFVGSVFFLVLFCLFLNHHCTFTLS